MTERGRGLAGRLRRAMEGDAERRRAEEEAARAGRERAAAARQELFRDLLAFARETGFLEASLRDGGLVLQHGARELRFAPVGEADGVEVRWDGQDEEESHRLYLEERLGTAWVWARKRRMRPREDRELLWDAGLEELLVVGLGLERPEPG